MQELIGKPMTWRTDMYGDIAVHVAKLSPNELVANLTIDGGPDATPCQRFPELADGIGFATRGQLVQRSTRPRRTRATELPTLPTPEQVHNVSAAEAAAMVKSARKPRATRMPRSQSADLMAQLRAEGKTEVTF